jgi:hypothetical protein
MSRFCLRSPKLNRDPGLYVRAMGKWYRVWVWGDWDTPCRAFGMLCILAAWVLVLSA